MQRQEAASKTVWKVGKLARLTGLSVRTLHHYDEIGLVSPAWRGEERGDRLYSAEEVLRLQQIRSLRSLGFSLREIQGCLDDANFSVRRVVGLHVSGLKEQIRLRQKLLRRLETVEERLRSADEVSVEELVNTAMEVMEMSQRIEKYYSPEQLEYLDKRRQEVGQQRIREVAAEWPRLMEQVRAEMEAGTDPADGRVQELAKCWMALVDEMTGGDADISRSIKDMWRQEENIQGIDTKEMQAMMEYISRANASATR